MIGIEGNGSFPGKKFHDFSVQFHQDAAGFGDKENHNEFLSILSTITPDTNEEFYNFIFERYYCPFIIQYGQKISKDQLNSLTRGVEIWAKYLLNFISPIASQSDDPNQAISSAFHKANSLIKHQYTFQDGVALIISGKPDVLLFDPVKNDVVVLEFKGHLASNITQDLVQTTLYAWLVKNQTGLIPRVEILYLEENQPLAQYSWENISQFIDQLPHLFESARKVIENNTPLSYTQDFLLCEKCSFNLTCDSDWGQRARTGEKSTILPPQIEDDEAKILSRKLVEVLSNLGIPSELDGYIKGPQFYRIKIVPDFNKGVSVGKVIRKAYDLQVALNLETAPKILPQGGHISIDIPRTTRDFITIDSITEMGQKNKPDSDASFPLGVNIDGKVFWVNLADPTMTSILIGGTSGSGKSVLLRSIIIGLGLISPQYSVLFTLIDPKRVTFTDFIDIQCLHSPVLMDPENVMGSLELAVSEMESRYRLFEQNKVTDIIKYNALGETFLPRRVIIVDEYADLILNKKTKESLETTIQRLGQKGRAAGFHLILATQRPDSKIVTGVIKANLQLKICMKVTSSVNSKIILDEGGGEFLMGYGDMLVGGSIGIQRLQAPIVTEQDIQRLKERLCRSANPEWKGVISTQPSYRSLGT